MQDVKDYDVVLASGAEHLRNRFLELGYRVFCCAMNYDGKRMFPNADIYARVPDVPDLSGRRTVVLQSCTGAGPAEIEPYTTSDRVVELLLMLDALRKPCEVEKIAHKKYKETPVKPAKRIEAILTFQPFALQDKAFRTGEAVSARWAIDTITRSCDKTWVVNPHAPDSLEWVKRHEQRGLYEAIDITPDLIQFGAKRFGFDEYIVVTPDEGGQERFSVAGYGKCRENSYSVELHGNLQVKGKSVIVIDDLTKSGSTLLKAASRLKAQGAKEVGMAVVHVLPLIGKGEELLEKLYEESGGMIVTSNTINTKVFCERNPTNVYNVVDSLVKKL